MVTSMDEDEQTAASDESAEGGALDDPGEGERLPQEPQTEPAEGGGLEQEAQRGKGYGADEGERYDALPDE